MNKFIEKFGEPTREDQQRKKCKPIKYIINEKGCHVCVSHCKNLKGYCFIVRNKIQMYLHRYVYEQYHGKILKYFVVCYSCDNPSCINPEHLFLGTQKENIQDMIKKGRGNKALGERVGSSKLNATQVSAIRADNRVNYKIAKDYGVDRRTIDRIKKGATWRKF